MKSRKELEKRKRGFADVRRKAQASLEFLILLIASMLLVLLLYASNLNKINEVFSASRQQEIVSGCESMASAINEVYYFGNGFSRNITAGEGFTIRLSNATIICYDSGKNHIGTILPPDVRNSTGHDSFEIKAALQNLRIENKGYILVS